MLTFCAGKSIALNLKVNLYILDGDFDLAATHVDHSEAEGPDFKLYKLQRSMLHAFIQYLVDNVKTNLSQKFAACILTWRRRTG